MTIVLDFSLVAPGGSATYAKAFLSALGARDDLADIVVLVGDHDGELDGILDRLVDAGARVQRTHLGTGWRSALRRQFVVPYYCARYRAKALYCPREAAPILAPTRLVVLARNLKVWTTAGSTTIVARSRWLARTAVSRLVVRRAARVLAVSSVMARALPPAAARSAIVVHHGCDLELVERSRLDDGEGSEPLRIVALGGINQDKRFDLLIEAVGNLRSLGRTADLDVWGVVGEPACADALRRQGHELLGADPLRGPVPGHQRQEILTDADVLAMGSSFESFGLPLLEAMRTSCLVWVPASDLVNELCGSVAVSYSAGSPVAAARALIEALPNAHARLAQGRERCESFTWETTLHKTLHTVREVAAHQNRGATGIRH